MVFRRRNLLNDSVQIISINCTHFCDPKTNPNGLCPLPCIPFCFVNCKSTLLLPQDPPPPPDFADLNSHPVKHFHVSLFLTVFLSILATSFFLFSFFTLFKLYRNWRAGGSGRSERHPEEDGGDERFRDIVDDDHGLTVDHPIWYIRTVGLQSSIINAIAVCKYKRGEGLVEGTECAVCLNDFQEDETLRLLPKCNHAFHIPCIDTWLRSHTNCPLCRAGIVSNTVVAAVPATEQSLLSSVPVQEPETQDEEQIEIEEHIETAEIEREVRNELSSNDEIRANNTAEEENEAQIGIKRSFSLDFVSALMVSAAVVKAFADESAGSKSNTQKKAEKQKGTSSSSSSSSSLMPGLMKRSLSCGGKVFSSRYNRRPSAILPR